MSNSYSREVIKLRADGYRRRLADGQAQAFAHLIPLYGVYYSVTRKTITPMLRVFGLNFLGFIGVTLVQADAYSPQDAQEGITFIWFVMLALVPVVVNIAIKDIKQDARERLSVLEESDDAYWREAQPEQYYYQKETRNAEIRQRQGRASTVDRRMERPSASYGDNRPWQSNAESSYAERFEDSLRSRMAKEVKREQRELEWDSEKVPPEKAPEPAWRQSKSKLDYNPVEDFPAELATEDFNNQPTYSDPVGDQGLDHQPRRVEGLDYEIEEEYDDRPMGQEINEPAYDYQPRGVDDLDYETEEEYEDRPMAQDPERAQYVHAEESLEEVLLRLKSWYEQGLISEEEYAQLRKKELGLS